MYRVIYDIPFAVILSEAKNLQFSALWLEILRPAQDDKGSLSMTR